MRTVTYNYQEIPSYQDASKKCCECNKSIRKTFKSSQTINPWNNKTPSQIHSENKGKNEIKVKEWLLASEACASCKKLSMPDVEITLLSDVEWNEVRKLKEDMIEASRFLRDAERHIQETFKGKSINLPNGRIGLIDGVSTWSFPKLQINYNEIRKDKKGITEKDEYINLEIPAPPKDETP